MDQESAALVLRTAQPQHGPTGALGNNSKVPPYGARLEEAVGLREARAPRTHSRELLRLYHGDGNLEDGAFGDAFGVVRLNAEINKEEQLYYVPTYIF